MTFSARALALCLFLSVLAHTGILTWLDLSAADLDTGLRFQLPSEVEFGLTESTAIADLGDPTSPTDAPSEQTEPEQPPNPVDPQLDRNSDVEGGPRENRDQARRARQRRTQDTYAQTRGTLPPGAQLALRVDMEEVRAAPIRDEVTRLLDSVPDWQLVLEGSGIDPVQDLERILVASPNLRRSRVVIAGRHRRDESWARSVTERLAAARGVDPEWRRLGPVEIARWANRDETVRVVALLGRRTFVICRERDLRSALVLARRNGGDGLLSIPEGALASFTVEGASRYASGAGVPERLLSTVHSDENGSIRLTGVGFYDDADTATQALDAFGPLRDRASRHMLVRAVGLSSAVQNLELRRDGAQVQAETRLTLRQARLILGLLEGQFRDFSRTRRRTDQPNGAATNATDRAD